MLTRTRETFIFKQTPKLGLDFKWMIGLRRLNFFNSVFKKTEKKYQKLKFIQIFLVKFQLQIQELKLILNISTITNIYLEGTIRPK